MGFNTTVVLLNDGIHELETDKTFGERLLSAIHKISNTTSFIDVAIGNHLNACQVIETHHADQMLPVFVGCNAGKPIRDVYVSWANSNLELTLLKELARKYDFDLHKKRK